MAERKNAQQGQPDWSQPDLGKLPGGRRPGSPRGGDLAAIKPSPSPPPAVPFRTPEIEPVRDLTIGELHQLLSQLTPSDLKKASDQLNSTLRHYPKTMGPKQLATIHIRTNWKAVQVLRQLFDFLGNRPLEPILPVATTAESAIDEGAAAAT